MGRFAPGTIFAGRYRIVGLLGRGGMGEVYRADDLTLDQPVALKFLPEKVTADPGRLERFYAEVRVARQVSHPNVCRIYDIGEEAGQHFISMEYIDGEDLSSLLRRIGRLPSDKALEIARQMCAGLAAAHEKGVLHRDFKPANVMLDGQGKVRIADFGLARGADEARDPQTIEGTPAYMAPEQFAGKGESIKSDLYSLGLVLYELFTGKPTFKAPTVSELARMHREANPTNPSILVTDLDPIIERVILRCLEKDPALRPASALAVSAALPGGDPLAAALAAGETPSPEMVAAAGEEGALGPLRAWAGLAYILAAAIILVLLSARTTDLSWIPQAKSPDSLAERSHDLLRKLGYVGEPLDSVYGYETTDFLRQARKEADYVGQMKKGEPPGLLFWYRQSPRYISNQNFFRSGVVQPNSPHQEDSGMITLRLDTGGRLVHLEAVPPQKDETAGARSGIDWNTVLSEAGFDPARFKSVAPAWVPPQYADTRMAWEGAYALRPDIPIRIEAAAVNGRLVYFDIINPWTKPSRMDQQRENTGSRILTFVFVFIFVGVIAGTVLLAWRNLKLNRGDRRGAFRITAYLFLMEMVGLLLRAHFVPDLGEFFALSWLLLSRALWFGTFAWIGYIALEPHVRRLWPHTIISWSRLLTGRFRDPRIGRDILIGAAFGITIPLLDELVFLTIPEFGPSMGPALGPASSVNLALGVRSFFGSLAQLATSAVSSAMYIFLLFFLLKIVLRKQWLAAAVFVLALVTNTTANASSHYLAAFLGTILWVSFLFLMLRYGLFAVMAFMISINIPEVFPVTANLSAWYSNASLFAMLFLVALALYAFRISLAGKPAFAFDLLKE
jgi:serine/threonine-protein kinase